MLETTLNKIEAYNPCENGWEKLLTFLGKTEADDEPLPLLTILESNGIEDAIWALRAVEGMDGPIRLFACFCARQCLDIFECEHPGDKQPRRTIETAERFARGQATIEELKEAKTAAEATAWNVIGTAAWAAAWAAVWAAGGAAAWDAAWAAVARAVKAGVQTASIVTTCAAAWDVFTKEFQRLCLLGKDYEPSTTA